jgi:hypothetical protein
MNPEDFALPDFLRVPLETNDPAAIMAAASSQPGFKGSAALQNMPLRPQRPWRMAPDIKINKILKKNYPFPISRVSFGGNLHPEIPPDKMSENSARFFKNQGNFVDLSAIIRWEKREKTEIFKELFAKNASPDTAYSLDVSEEILANYLTSLADRPSKVDWNIHLTQYIADMARRYELEFIDLVVLTGVDTLQPAEQRYSLIEEVFQHFETAVSADFVKQYGVESHSLDAPADSPQFTSLEKILEIAQRAAENLGSSSHFTTLRFPLNIFQNSILSRKNQQNNKLTAVELAQRNDLFLWSTSPYHGFDRAGNRIRFVSWDLPPTEKPSSDAKEIPHIIAKELKEIWNFVITFEMFYPDVMAAAQKELRAELAADNPKNLDPANLPAPPPEHFTWAMSIAKHRDVLNNIDVLEESAYNVLVPRLYETIAMIKENYPKNADLQDYMKRYRGQVMYLLNRYRAGLILGHYHETEEINQFIAKIQPKLANFVLLEHKCVVLCLAAGVDSVLIDDPSIYIQINYSQLDKKLQFDGDIDNVLTREEALHCLQQVSLHFLTEPHANTGDADKK